METPMDIDVAVPAAAEAVRETAVARTFRVSEVVCMILAHITRDKVDLLSASLVCKQIRAVAVPLLWRELDVPLSKIGRLNEMLLPFKDKIAANPRVLHLFPLSHTRYLRIWDDEAHRRFRHEPHSKPTYFPEPWRAHDPPFTDHANPQWNDRRWELDVSNLSAALKTAGKSPLIELSFGVISSSSVNHVLQVFPQMAERVAAIRVLSDAIEHADGAGIPDEEEAVKWWAGLVEAVSTICLAQDNANSHALKAFCIEDYDAAPEEHPRMDQDGWKTLAKTLAHRLQQLSIQLPVMDGIEGGYKHILGADWPQLRHFYLKMPTFSLDRHGWFISEEEEDRLWDGLQECLETFFDRHTHLEHIEIKAPYALPAPTHSQTFPNLKRLSVYKKGADLNEAFFGRHPVLNDFFFPLADDDDDDWEQRDSDFFSIYTLTPALRIVRSPAYSLSNVFSYNCAVSHIVPEPMGRIADLCLDERTFQGNFTARNNISCLNFELYNEEIQDLTARMGTLFHPSVFPKLTELVLTCTKAEDLGSAMDSAKCLRRILIALQFAPNLRALHIEFMGAKPLPPDAELRDMLTDVPRQLRYLSWHSPKYNQTQYYRFARHRTEFGQYGYWHEDGIQSLPASSRLRVSQDGVWSRSSSLRDDKCIFDHTCSPPQLL
ncbi:hypothetical protein A4X13_0g7888 [Tilletia indica]|uniref:Uncharacterized protein n=1 Tax=Tilletia indica TaxID=43049 RepID=A0A177TN62_9BASI|nr:hypothetical protein A4X13_0g7888 [Tilletia indica]